MRADATVTLGALKLGLLLLPARAYMGMLFVGEIGLEAEIESLPDLRYYTFDDVEFLNKLPVRDSSSRTSAPPARRLLIAGSRQFPGAAILCARGAARAGAGYVTLAAPAKPRPALRAHLVEQVVVEYTSDDPARTIDVLECAVRTTAVRSRSVPASDSTTRPARSCAAFVERCELPIVADAGALFHFAKNLEILRGKRCVLDAARGRVRAPLRKRHRRAAARARERLREFVARTGITTLLKGDATLVDDGRWTYVNTTGTNALCDRRYGRRADRHDRNAAFAGSLAARRRLGGGVLARPRGAKGARQRRVGVVAGDLPEFSPRLCPIPESLGNA